MYVLQRIEFCLQKGRLNQHHDIIREEPSGTDPCPICGSVRQCDVHWESDLLMNGRNLLMNMKWKKLRTITMELEDVMYFWRSTWTFQPQISYFRRTTQKPQIERILERIRKRISMHQDGQRTYELIFVSRSRGTMQAKMGVKEKFGGELVDQWRFDLSHHSHQ